MKVGNQSKQPPRNPGWLNHRGRRTEDENLAGTLSDGTLAFQMQRLSELPLAAIVIEARYSAIFKLEHVDGAWLADQLARLHVRYPDIHLVYADTRRHAEDWTHRFLTTALTDSSDPNPDTD